MFTKIAGIKLLYLHMHAFHSLLDHICQALSHDERSKKECLYGDNATKYLELGQSSRIHIFGIYILLYDRHYYGYYGCSGDKIEKIVSALVGGDNK